MFSFQFGLLETIIIFSHSRGAPTDLLDPKKRNVTHGGSTELPDPKKKRNVSQGGPN